MIAPLIRPENILIYAPMQSDLVDRSGNGNNGTAVASPTYTEGKNGGALTVDASNHAYFPTLSLSKATPFSWSFWVYFTGQPSANVQIINVQKNPYAAHDFLTTLAYFPSVNAFYFQYTDAGTLTVNCISQTWTPANVANRWFHIVCGYDPSKVYQPIVSGIQVNGIAGATQPDTQLVLGTATNRRIDIGYWNDLSPQYPLTGKISHFTHWNTGLTTKEKQILYHSQKGAFLL